MRIQDIRLATSGRDQLARSVLNDEWVSHPTWASEEAGFVAHKKNSFEEVIHRCEDERHEYQIQLEGLARTIAILEPLATRLSEMSPEERSGLRLRPDLGGQSRWIYVRTLKKVYSKDAGTEVYQALQDAPAVAVPVVLARLKQKNEEWRRAQREWSHTWRQVDARNFYKSLDHTGINYKQNDKKTITTKAFVTEIEGVRTEQEEQRQQAREERRTRTRPACTRGSLGFQLTYSFADSGVLYDALKLVYIARISTTVRRRTASWSVEASSVSSGRSCPCCACSRRLHSMPHAALWRLAWRTIRGMSNKWTRVQLARAPPLEAAAEVGVVVVVFMQVTSARSLLAQPRRKSTAP